ncbi:DUF3089 domain-containing protein [Desulforhopalus sp. 52FAK]
MNNYRHLSSVYFFLIVVLIFISASHSLAMTPFNIKDVPAAPDYGQATGWLAKPTQLDSPVDVFFVYPTVLFNDTDWLMDTERVDMRKAAQASLDTQAVVFKGHANIFAPMYRQMNLAGLGLSKKDASPLQEIVHDDVWQAFNHYLKYENNGRPFFLAGHSQGSMILTDLMLNHWGATGAEERMIAAFLLGWSMTQEDLASNSAIEMCDSRDQTGCIISYNTMAAGRQSVAPTLKKGAIAVNPLSWTMDGNLVSAEQNLGSVFFKGGSDPVEYPQFTSAQIVDGGLIVHPADKNLVTVKGSHFPEGIYHAFDYSLFFMNIKVNIAERIEAFFSKNQ